LRVLDRFHGQLHGVHPPGNDTGRAEHQKELNMKITVTKTAPVKAVRVLTPQQKLKQFATKPVIKPPNPTKLTKKLQSYF
jgi:hypothetical protein